MPNGAEPQVVGRYVLYDVIAAGGMAAIHLGRQRGAAGFNKTVAVKRTHPHFLRDREFVTSFLDEARLASRIQHPNVVPVTDVIDADGELLLVMEYVHGVQLSRLVRRMEGRGAPPSVIVAIVAGALRGLEAAHDAVDEEGKPLNIVHRDVSPQNILVGTDGIARILDFGIAKAEGRLTGTESGMLKGKLSYMAPEQLLSEPVSRRTDIYAMGVVLWEALTGQRFVDGDSEGARAIAALSTSMRSPSELVAGLPKALDAIVLRAAARDSAERFATCAEMADALVRLEGLAPATHKEVGAWVRSLANDELSTLERRVREIESRMSPSQPDITDRFAAAPSSAHALDNAEPAPPASDPNVPDTQLTYGAPPVARRQRSSWVAVLVGVAVALAGVAAAAFALKRPDAPAAAGLVAPVVSTSPVETPPPSSESIAAPPTTSLAPSAEASAAAPNTIRPAPARRAAKPAKSAESAPATPAKPKPASCSPPYVLDAEGNRKWKRECL
jgi:eukaryotic-like serine/threonine-protein kinase